LTVVIGWYISIQAKFGSSNFNNSLCEEHKICRVIVILMIFRDNNYLQLYLGRYMSTLETQKRQGTLLKVFVLIAGFIIFSDILASIKYHYDLMVILESVVLNILLYILLLFKYLKLSTKVYMALVSVSLLTVLSLTIEGYNQSFVLFSLAIIPMYSFYFLGLRKGLYWNIIIVFLVVLSVFNTYALWIKPVFTTDILFQVLLSYIGITYFHYKMEEKKYQYEESLANMVYRRGILLKELHHRSKNNLHLIMGLLETQALFTENKECKDLLTSQRARLKTMSLVHENLSGEAKDEKIEMSEYLSKICNSMQNYTEHTIIQNFDNLRLNVNDGMNIGLFFNEALSNAIEHAYDEDDIGDIEVSLCNTDTEYKVAIKDKGKGFNTQTDHNSLGLILMEDICGFFPDTFMEFRFAEGTEVIATFQKKQYNTSK